MGASMSTFSMVSGLCGPWKMAAFMGPPEATKDHTMPRKVNAARGVWAEGGSGMPERVGFIGLGAMGGPMALNLVKHGFALVVHDIDAAKVERLVARGAAKADSAEAVAAQVERTICMVETTAQAESVIAGEHGIIKSASS